MWFFEWPDFDSLFLSGLLGLLLGFLLVVGLAEELEVVNLVHCFKIKFLLAVL